MKLPFNIDVSCTEKTETSFKLKSQDDFTVLMTRIPGYWKHVHSALFPLKTSAFKSLCLCFISHLCLNWHQRVIIGHIRLMTLLQGSSIGVKITKHLLSYPGVCRLLVPTRLLNWSSWVGVQTAQLCPLLLHVQPPTSPFICPLYHLFPHNV